MPKKAAESIMDLPAALTKVDKFWPERSLPTDGNGIELLRSGAEYFPSLLEGIARAQREIRIETYIFADDEQGVLVRESLIAARRRGVEVRLVLDGYGGREGINQHVPLLRAAGVLVRIFRPETFLFRPNPRRLRRMHRKLVVIDRAMAWVGGINLIDDLNIQAERTGLQRKEDQLQRKPLVGPLQPANLRRMNETLLSEVLGPRFDFAVKLQGPVVRDVWRASEWLWWQIGPDGRVTDSLKSKWWKARADQLAQILRAESLEERPARCGQSRVQLLLRDNLRFRRTIEKSYLKAIGEADREVILANAYFIPGHRVRRALQMARKRGVRVRLLLQGQVEYRFQHYATQALYSSLLRSGVEIHEYLPSFLHAKVAVVDGNWATVGSSNLDPLSFLMAREANVSVWDRQFASELTDSLNTAIERDSRRVVREAHLQRPLTSRLFSWLCYGALRLAVTLWGFGGRY